MQLINILIRTHNRQELFTRCLKSITDQNYTNLRIIVSTDCNDAYIPENIEIIHVTPSEEIYFYDKYINDLKAMVTDGWYMVLDDDDQLTPNCLHQIVLDAPAIVHRINHIGNIVGRSLAIGQIGMPNLMLHHSLKNLVDFDGLNHGDYHYAKRLAEKVQFVFRDLIVVECDRKGNGI